MHQELIHALVNHSTSYSLKYLLLLCALIKHLIEPIVTVLMT